MLSTYFENRLNHPVTERDGEVESELSSNETRKHNLRLRKYTEKKKKDITQHGRGKNTLMSTFSII